jgi:DNA-binding NarL/FixJ family response regulator
MGAYRIILADDHPIVRQGIKDLLSKNPYLQVIGEAANGQELLELLNKTRPDLIVLDIQMPRLGGLEAAYAIKKRYPRVKVLILTMHKEDPYLTAARGIGIEGFVLKDDIDQVLLSAIETLRQGGTFTSPLLQGQDDEVDVGKT